MTTALSEQQVTPTRPILLMAGGTGGHVFPALAVAEELQARGLKVHWLGTRQGMEARIIPSAQIDISYINISGLRGKGVLSLLMAPFKITLAIWQALRILRTHRPLAVIGMGGFVSGPGGIATVLMRIPLFIHEQNAIAGLTNRWLARIATRVMQAYPNTFPAHLNAVHTGNPLRVAITQAMASKTPRKTTSPPFHILIIGGSLGAKALNEVVPQALQQVNVPLEILHQTGQLHVQAMQTAYHVSDTIQVAKVTAFIDNMSAAYQWADLVICRAGALTLSEVAQMGVPSILIPYPHAVDDHQTENAKYLANQGAAILLPQTELTVDKLATLLNELLAQPERRYKMSIAAQQCATPQARQHVTDVCLQSLLNTTANMKEFQGLHTVRSQEQKP